MRHLNLKADQSPCSFVCPNCKASLCIHDTHLLCETCKSSWDIVDDIPRFAKTEVEWSVFDSEISKEVTKLAKKKGWQEAIDAYSHTLGAYTLQYINDESRADWHIIMPLDKNATVLDIGSGWGNIALSLSKWCKHVYCCDVNMTNLRLLDTRLRDNNIENISTFQYEANSFLKLPFLDSSIDAVVLNGVLEWMGAAEIDASPYHVQISALKEIKRILKPGGVLYIGIENRYSFSTILGQRIHGELPFVGLLPRWISNWITKSIQGKPHRTYIYSLRGYRKLLKKAGFKQTDFYQPYPSYHHPNYLIPLKPAWVKRFWFDKLSVSRTMKYRIAKRLGLSRFPFHWFAYSFSIRCIK